MSFWHVGNRDQERLGHIVKICLTEVIKDIIILLLFDEIIITPIVQVIMAYQLEQLE